LRIANSLNFELMKPPKIIAEIGCNHKGDIMIAKEMIHVAAYFCKVDVVKFQKRCPKELLSYEQYNAPHPNPMHSYGKTYGEHREFLEFNLEQHQQLKSWCEDNGVDYSSSVWDITSAKEVVSINPKLIKIPSACNQNYSMLGFLCDNYAGDIHISVGMTTHQEEDDLIGYFEKKNRLKSVVLYSCTSGYPVSFEDICLLEIKRLKQKFGGSVKSIGFSGHHLGIAADVAAMAFDAEWIERHYTLDRTWKGTDHAASLEPDGLRRLSRDIRNVAKAIENKKSEILDVEFEQRKKLRGK
jgi:sialic acid synthase